MGVTEVMYSYGLCLLSIVILILIVYLQLRITKNELRQGCMLVLTCALICNISLMFQIVNIKRINTWVWYEAFNYIGMSTLPIVILYSVLVFIKPEKKIDVKKIIMLMLLPSITIICMFTNQYHHLVFIEFSTYFSECEYGILFYVYTIYLYIVYSIAIGSLIRYLAQNYRSSLRQLLIVLIFIAFPYMIQILSVTKVICARTFITAIIQSIGCISIVSLLLRYQILISLPISLENVLNTISDAFVVINSKNKIVIYNKIFLDIFNLGKLDLKNMDFTELIEFNEFDTINIEDIENILNEKDKVSFERKSEVLKSTLKYEGYYLTKSLVLITVSNVTKYSHDIQQIQLNHDVILGKERLASLGQMIGGIAHNLKTPIFSIAGGMEGLEELVKEYRESIDDETVTVSDHKDIASDMKNWTAKIKGYLSYMTDIITAIQMQTAGNSGSASECFSIKELIKYINILMKYELKQNLIDLKINCSLEETKVINGNINSLIQVLNNLISNSIQAYANLDKDKIIELKIYGKEKDKNIYIEIEDYAGGIPEEISSKLFKEMVTTKGKNGTGLGLFISYTNIKTQFGGNLTFYTKKDEGTIFRIIIPNKV